MVVYVYSLVAAYREGMSGGLNPVILTDVLNSLELDNEEKLLVYECMRDIIDVENKQRSSADKQKTKTEGTKKK
jgi:hypothetical protein